MYKRLAEILKSGHRSQKGITGLETAIILIAFVTVAAVFGYAVLSAGIFSAEKGKETVFLGLEEAKSTMEITGSVIATGDNTTDTVTTIVFTVRNAVGGEAIDLTEPGATGANKCIMAYVDTNQYHNDVMWTRTWVGFNDGDTLLELGEKAQITFDCTDIDGSSTPLNPALGPYQQFTIEFKPPVGSVITVERVLPGDMDAVMGLH
jgi:flagellin FlaB